MRLVKIALLVVLVAVIGFLARYGDWFEAAAPPLEPGTIPGIRRNSRPLGTVEPGRGFVELQFLKPLVAGKRLVMAGEAADGAHDFFAVKHRLFEFLVRELGFTVFVLEAPYESGLEAGRYVAEGAGEPREVVRRMGDWRWDTKEFLGLLEWMRAYNEEQGGGPKLKFYCFDGNIPGGSKAGREERMAANVKGILDREGPQARAFLWGRNQDVSRLPGRMGESLSRLLGSQQYSIGFEFNRGDFRTRGMSGVKIFTVEPAPQEYYAYALARTGSLVFFLDLAAMRGDEVLDRWLLSPHWMREYDESYWRSRYFRKMNSVKATLPDLYDGLIFVQHLWPVAFAGGQPGE